MSEAPLIDDRRRFKELWKELLFARVLAGAAAGGAVGIALTANVYTEIFDVSLWFLLPPVLLLVSAPSAMAKRGWKVPLAVTVVAAASLIPSLLVLDSLGTSAALIAFGITMGTGIGVVEGLSERAITTVFSGLIGGTLTGWVTGRFLDAFSHRFFRIGIVTDLENIVFFLAYSIGFYVLLHVGIGLSLALGRWIRDLPKRKAAQAA